PGKFAAVAAGRLHTCAIRDDGSTACWGVGSSGQIGGGILATWSPTRVTLPAAASAIDAGGGHACALVGGVPYCWGDDHDGQLGGGGDSIDHATPLPVPGLASATSISTGRYHACATQSGTTITCWGLNADGEIGNNRTQDIENPVPVTSVMIDEVTGGGEHTC